VQHICNVVEKAIKLPPIKPTPQTINVVTRQKIKDFGFTTIRDILNNTPIQSYSLYTYNAYAA